MSLSIFKKIFRRKSKAKVPQEQKYKGEIAATYLEKRAHKPGWHLENLALASFISSMPSGLKVLDVPFGTGRFMPIYTAKQWQVTGVDISEEMLVTARRYNPKKIVQYTELRGDVLEIPFQVAEFDVVVSYRFLGYILTVEKAEQTIRKLAGVTKSYMILSLQHLLEGASPGPEDKMGHRMYWGQVETLLNSCQLEVVQKVDGRPHENYLNTIVLLRKTA